MKQLLIFLFFLCSVSVLAQDEIVKKDGSTIVCRVVEVTTTEIAYKKWGNLNGSTYVMDKSLVAAINYENGKKVTIGETESLYKPGNQNDGVQNYNDAALLKIDEDAHFTPPTSPKVKTLRIIGVVGGGALAASGLIYLASSSKDDKGKHSSSDEAITCGLLGCGGICVATCFIIAHKTQKRIESQYYNIHSLYQHNIPFNNGSSLSVGADMVSNDYIGSNTLCLGLRYNF